MVSRAQSATANQSIPSSSEAARALASLLAAAFPDLNNPSSSSESTNDSTVPGSSTDTSGTTSVHGEHDEILASSSSTPVAGMKRGRATRGATTLAPAPPTPPPATQPHTWTYTPQPTRSGRVPQLPNPDDVDHSTLLFNEYLNFDYLNYPSDDEDDDPDFQPASEAFSAGEMFTGDFLDNPEDAGDYSVDEAESDDLSAMEDAWGVDESSPAFTGDALTPSEFTNDILVNSLPSTSHLPLPSVSSLQPAPIITTSHSKPKLSRVTALKGKGKGKSKAALPPVASISGAQGETADITVDEDHPTLSSAPALSPSLSTSPSRKRQRQRNEPVHPVPTSPEPTPSLAAPPPEPLSPAQEPRGRGRPKKYRTEASLDERKHRNREAAQESRRRAKAKIEEDQERLAELEVENAALRDRVLELEHLLADHLLEEKRRGRGGGNGGDESEEEEDEEVESRPPRKRSKGTRGTRQNNNGKEENYEGDGNTATSGLQGGLSGQALMAALRSPEGLSELSKLLTWAAKGVPAPSIHNT
ncbi:hypothetical protein T439DRAFT_376432 [Meredithblackwellia eburnea MCA 4105]